MRSGGAFFPLVLVAASLSACTPQEAPAANCGTGGMGGAGGADGTGGSIFIPEDPPGPKDPDLVARAAVFTVSCIRPLFDIFGPYVSIRNRLDWSYSWYPTEPHERALSNRIYCFKDKSNGCDAVKYCFGYETHPSKVNGYTGCENGVVSYVDSGWYSGYDCTRVGLSCPTFDKTPTSCVDGTWGDQCENRGTASCDNNQPVYCDLNWLLQKDMPCDEYGLSCAKDDRYLDWGYPQFPAYCVSNGPSCTQKVGPSWGTYFGDVIDCVDSTHARICMNGHETVIDCGTRGKGFTCRKSAKNPSHAYCGIGDECVPNLLGSLDTHCEGSSVVFCNGGRAEKVDCKALGFKDCDPATALCIPGGGSEP